jgi:hypothetical protein
MRLLMAVVLAPALFAQARGGARPVAAPVRRAVGPVVRAAAPVTTSPTAGVRPVGPVVGPVVLFGYYPNPLYYGSGYSDGAGYNNGYAPPPAQGDSGPAPAYYGADPSGQGYPSVLVNPNYAPDTAHPLMRDYSYLPATSPGDGDDTTVQPTPAASVIFLIAMKDHTIYPAIAYWVEDDTLNYITQQGVRNRVSLGLVDRDFSTQLNKERSIDFALPPSVLPQAVLPQGRVN